MVTVSVFIDSAVVGSQVISKVLPTGTTWRFAGTVIVSKYSVASAAKTEEEMAKMAAETNE
jgi:hypothetical protein